MVMGMRPRALTSNPLVFAHSRMAWVCSFDLAGAAFVRLLAIVRLLRRYASRYLVRTVRNFSAFFGEVSNL